MLNDLQNSFTTDSAVNLQ